MLIILETLFWSFALLGSLLFIVWLTLHFAHKDITRWLKTAASFSMMFGWVGLICLNHFLLPHTSSVIVACAGGLSSISLMSLKSVTH